MKGRDSSSYSQTTTMQPNNIIGQQHPLQHKMEMRQHRN